MGLILLLLNALPFHDLTYALSVAVFGISLIILYGASTLYHSAKDPVIRKRWRTVDHAAIYVLIAGTYTPFTLVTLAGPVGTTLFAVCWGMAAVGIFIKVFVTTARFKIVSTAMYVFMGWIIVFAWQPLVAALSGPGLAWLIAGGIAYTLGAVIYIIRLPYAHSIFHVFVLGGSYCHFVAVYRHLLPNH